MFSFVNHEINLESARFDIIHRILDDPRISISCLVESAKHCALIVLIFSLIEFLGTEEAYESAILGLLHRPCQLVLLDMVISSECDSLDLDLLASVHGKLDTDGRLDHCIPLGVDIHLDIKESLLLIVSLDDIGSSLRYIFREFATSAQVEPLHKLLLLTGFHSAERPAGNSRPFHDADLEERSVP